MAEEIDPGRSGGLRAEGGGLHGGLSLGGGSRRARKRAKQRQRAQSREDGEPSPSSADASSSESTRTEAVQAGSSGSGAAESREAVRLVDPIPGAGADDAGAAPAAEAAPAARRSTSLSILPAVDEAGAPVEGDASPEAAGDDDRGASKSVVPQPPAYERALAAYAQGNNLEALALFEKALADDPANHKARSYWGLLLVLERGQSKRGLDAAEDALRAEPSSIELYRNLAMVHVKLENKGHAIDLLRKAMQLHGEDESCRTLLTKLGVRRTPPIRFLPRSHPVNKYVGIFLYRWLKLR